MKRLFAASFFTILVGCAVQSRPQGGPKDETPPRITKMAPALGELNFSGNKAEIVFDEYIQGSKLLGSISTSPPLEGLEFEITGKKLRLDWDEGQLLENTTYRISLGDEIGDLNENNKYTNLEIVWSTGSFIDSMQLGGEIDKSGKGAFEDLTIWLIPAGADTIGTPKFSATPGKSGEFELRYLPVDTFDLLVFEDINFNKSYDEGETFGFLKDIPTSSDSSFISIPYSTNVFAFPELDTAAIDSVANYIDTTSKGNLGQISFTLPPSSDSIVLFAHRAGNVIINLSSGAISDTIATPLEYYPPGKYELFGYIDVNANGSWDSPSWTLNTSGEPLISGQTFEIKANWELEQPVILPTTNNYEVQE
jgi:hypothetical protein